MEAGGWREPKKSHSLALFDHFNHRVSYSVIELNRGYLR